MFQIACTRFNTQTYKENRAYRLKYNEHAIYGISFKIRSTYSPGTLMFVAEMNNDTNEIEGIGLIRNTIVTDKVHKMYQNNDYNRIFYRGDYWLSRSQISELDTELIEILDNVLFKGKSHLKRQSGITILTDKLFYNWTYELEDVKNKVKNMFLKHFKDTEINNLKSNSRIEI